MLVGDPVLIVSCTGWAVLLVIVRRALIEAEFAFGVSSSCKVDWVQRRVRARAERLMLRRSRAEREGGSWAEG